MTDRIMAGTYSDFKIVKTRRVIQMIIEFPIEHSKEFTDMFGMPQPDMEQHIAVARLKEISTPPPTATKTIQQAGIVCKQPEFGEFLRDKYNMADVVPSDSETIVSALRALCGIKSRTEFNTDAQAAEVFNRIYREFTNSQM